MEYFNMKSVVNMFWKKIHAKRAIQMLETSLVWKYIINLTEKAEHCTSSAFLYMSSNWVTMWFICILDVPVSDMRARLHNFGFSRILHAPTPTTTYEVPFYRLPFTAVQNYETLWDKKPSPTVIMTQEIDENYFLKNHSSSALGCEKNNSFMLSVTSEKHHSQSKHNTDLFTWL